MCQEPRIVVVLWHAGETQFKDNDGDIPTIGSGCYESEEQREIARLKREMRDTQNALDVFKKAISILGKD